MATKSHRRARRPRANSGKRAATAPDVVSVQKPAGFRNAIKRISDRSALVGKVLAWDLCAGTVMPCHDTAGCLRCSMS
jgi:hypothetical protein